MLTWPVKASWRAQRVFSRGSAAEKNLLEEPDRQDLLTQGVEDQLLGAVARDARLLRAIDLSLETDGRPDSDPWLGRSCLNTRLDHPGGRP